MIESDLDFAFIQNKLKLFHAKYSTLPNTIILPANHMTYTTRVSEIFGLEVIFGCVKEPEVALRVK